jgi:hypothetical protein
LKGTYPLRTCIGMSRRRATLTGESCSPISWRDGEPTAFRKPTPQCGYDTAQWRNAFARWNSERCRDGFGHRQAPRNVEPRWGSPELPVMRLGALVHSSVADRESVRHDFAERAAHKISYGRRVLSRLRAGGVPQRLGLRDSASLAACRARPAAIAADLSRRPIERDHERSIQWLRSREARQALREAISMCSTQSAI